MLHNIFIAFLISLFVGLIFTILERVAAKLYRKYRLPWHVQRGYRKRRLNYNDMPIDGSEYMKWECVFDYGLTLEHAIHDLQMYREVFGGEYYRLRNWRTKEIIPGELLLSDQGPILKYGNCD